MSSGAKGIGEFPGTKLDIACHTRGRERQGNREWFGGGGYTSRWRSGNSITPHHQQPQTATHGSTDRNGKRARLQKSSTHPLGRQNGCDTLVPGRSNQSVGWEREAALFIGLADYPRLLDPANDHRGSRPKILPVANHMRFLQGFGALGWRRSSITTLIPPRERREEMIVARAKRMETRTDLTRPVNDPDHVPDND